MKYRKLRIAWSVGWGVVVVLLIALSVRNLNRVDRITWYYSLPNAVQISFEPGSAVVATFTDQPVPSSSGLARGIRYQPWLETVRFYSPTKAAVGFSTVSRPNYEGVRLPMWFLILIATACTSLPWMRFSLLTLFVATTLLAALLGLVVWLSH